MAATAFDDELADRSDAVYADFFLPDMASGARVLDCGCGGATITVGLAQHVPQSWVIGIDQDARRFGPAKAYAESVGIHNVTFAGGDAHRLPFATKMFDAVFCHSVLETLATPLPALQEIHRVLSPGGTIGVACVDYGGLLLSGPFDDLLRQFYVTRERLWLLDGIAAPRIGRNLRAWLHEAGFENVRASAQYLSYGTHEAVRRFAHQRSRDCSDASFREPVLKHQLVAEADLDAMQAAWEKWAESPEAFLAFAWCRALANKPAPH